MNSFLVECLLGVEALLRGDCCIWFDIAVHHHHHRGDILSLRLEECVETSPPENDVLVCVCYVSLKLYTESICFLRLHIDARYQLHITALLSLYLRGLICCD